MNLTYAFALLLSACLSVLIVLGAWKRRSAPGATGLVLAMLAFAEWALAYAIRWMMVDPAAQYFWLDATYIGVVFGPPFLLIFSLQFTNRHHLITKRNLILLAIEPVLTLLILWTDNSHGLFYGGMRSSGAILNGGPWFWFNVVYLYAILLVVLGLLTLAFFNTPRIYRQQTGLILAGMLLPFLSNILSLVKLSPFPDLDITPFAFILTGVFFSIGLFRYHFLDVVPIARSTLIENMNDGVIVLDLSNRIIDINPAAKRILGASMDGIEVTEITSLKSFPGLKEILHAKDEEKIELHFENTPSTDFEVHSLPLYDSRQRFAGQLIVLHDITQRKIAEMALRESEEHFRSVVQTATDAIITVEATGNIIAWNKGAQSIFQYTKEEVIGESLSKLMPKKYRSRHTSSLNALAAGGEPHILGQLVQVDGIRKDGTIFPIELVLSSYTVNEKKFFSGIIRDITVRRQLEIALEYQSTHDILTGLFNRQYYEAEIKKLQNSRQIPISILMIDVDHLKKVNDLHGHSAGDELLRHVAEILKSTFRPEDVVARVGGDEFVVILPRTGNSSAKLAVQRLKKRMDEFNQMEQETFKISLSIGSATGDPNSILTDVVIQADQAMYKEKTEKKVINIDL